MRIRSGTLVELFDRSAIPSEAAVGELCLIINECGYGVDEVSDSWNETVIGFSNRDMHVHGSMKVDRIRGVFDTVVVDHRGLSHRMATNNDVKVFEYISGYLTEEVDLKDKYANLSSPARNLLSWLLQQYASSGVYAFSINDIGSDMSASDKNDAVDLLIQQGFLRMTRKDTLVLDRTLADDMRGKSDILGGNDDEQGLDIV